MDLLSLPFSWTKIFEDGEPRRALESEVLPKYIPQCRWFGGKARNPQRFTIQELIKIPATLDNQDGEPAARLALVRIQYADQSEDTYAVPLQAGPVNVETMREASPHAVLAELSDGALFDALQAANLRSGIMALISEGQAVAGEIGEVAGVPGKGLPADAMRMQSRVLKVEQSNSSIIYSDADTGAPTTFVKLFRKLEDGMNPDVEITRYLAEERGFAHVPPFAGMLKYRRPEGEHQVLALALGMIPNDGDAWAFTLREVEEYYGRVRERGASAVDFAVPGLLDSAPNPQVMEELLGGFSARARQLGTRTGELHMALGAQTNDPAFASESLTADDLRELAEEIRSSSKRAWELLSAPETQKALTPEQLAEFQPLETVIRSRADAVSSQPVKATKTRTHGDYHLGQVLNTGEDFVIIDFEGEPLRPLAERKAKRSPLRDVAGMLRSFHYAAHSGLGQADDAAQLLPWAEAWAAVTSRIFLRAWREATAGAAFVPHTEEELRLLLDAFLLEKALYEVAYELNNRPGWVGIPLRGIAAVLR